ncbi:YeeE/YedE family protein [Paracoccus sp. (in: a-proteobacteria)]|uniref:YeeE/YedE family protein n=1 Tax=Paracoccus sp. TaxID=267 RepID=UPI0028A098EF|nr:YeeE/YedE family protein [Paracoccus sp. (in: a-proteobacteria)]
MEMEWLRAGIGGLMIGCAAAIYLLVNGRIMGASGIFGGLIDGSAKGAERLERLAFVLGLIAFPALMVWSGFGQRSAPVASGLGLGGAGLLVGLGTRMANGCTSGHGVCGVSRLAWRGIVATLTYLIFGVVGVLVARAFGWMI